MRKLLLALSPGFRLSLGALLCVAVCGAAARAAAAKIDTLRVEYAENPLGIDVFKPRMSWQLESSERGLAQGGYEIRVAQSDQDVQEGRDLLWDSGKIQSDESIQHPYEGPALQSRQRYFWQVRVWDGQGHDLGWSAAAHWEMGLLTPQDWSARWVAAPAVEDPGESGVPPMLRREFRSTGPVKSARVYVSSHGVYELSMNGHRIGEDVLAPGWTSYGRRLQYQTYDVTDLLKQGSNAIGAYLGNGWYRGVVGYEGIRNHYGDRLALILQLEITYTDGHMLVISSDGNWKASTGPILMSEIYDGETYDARREQIGWTSPEFDDHAWTPVETISAATAALTATEGPPVRRREGLVPKRIFKTPSGDTVVDFGQNMVGWVRLKVRGGAGTVVTLRHAEVLDRDGNFYTENLRTAKQTVQYTLSGRGVEIYEPHFTFQGFRYVAVSGYPGKLSRDSLTGIAVHSDMASTSAFKTSRTLINQLHHNILWGQKGNFVDVPTDCPQRDERLGWTGDAQVFSSTAAFNMDVAGFFTKWLKDLAADQLPSGSVPFVVPDILSKPEAPAAGAAGWGDAATVIPWNMYLAYGDLRILDEQYASMQKWVAYEQSRAGADDIWDGDFHFGDWLDYLGIAKNTRYGSTSTDLIATAYFAHSTDILRRASELLGKSKEASQYGQSLAKIKEAFQHKFVNPDGSVGEGTQTAYVLALDFDLVPDTLRKQAAQKLLEDVRSTGHLTTGFLGTPHLLSVLSRNGYLKEAYTLLNREDFPSWLYPVKQGATTIWERWDGIKPDGTFESKEMNSFNHYAYGAVGEWMYEVIGGINIDPAHPGYKHILIQPQPGGGLTHASASHVSPYGRVSTEWSWNGHILELVVIVPPNTTASIRLPGGRSSDVSESRRPLQSAAGIVGAHQDGTDLIVEVGSGRYTFKYPYRGY